MKKIILFSTLLSSMSFAQVQTTTASGNFFNPLLWDCLCVPASGDSLVINHNMQLTASIYYNSGQIKVNASGSLIEDAMDRDVWVDGTGSLINNGTFDCYRLYVSDGSFTNTSYTVYFDSLWNQGTIVNSGDINAYDVLNDQGGVFTNSGLMTIDHDFYNAGDFYNSMIITVANNFVNCNLQTEDAMFVNDGTLCAGNDMSNCLGDTLDGSGTYFIGVDAVNMGAFEGTFFFNAETSFNQLGTVNAGVTIGTAVCNLAIKESEQAFSIYPNPANDILNVSTTSNFSYQIFDMSGKLIMANDAKDSRIDISTIAKGIYSITIVDLQGNLSTQKFVKQ